MDSDDELEIPIHHHYPLSLDHPQYSFHSCHVHQVRMKVESLDVED